jgi:hypothetical protein
MPSGQSLLLFWNQGVLGFNPDHQPLTLALQPWGSQLAFPYGSVSSQA